MFIESVKLRIFGLLKIPLIWFISPKVLKLTKNQCTIKVPLLKRNKNHLGSMYFGVLCTAADLAGGLIAMERIKESKRKIHLVFKDFHAEFYKRVEGDALFMNDQGEEIGTFVQKVIDSKDRMDMPVNIIAKVPSQLGDEIAAKFTLTLSLKLKEEK
ncbi:MAG: YiiD C-terminal domain-containing protein [Halobacteriovoraceae bacterium]|nr:YiiD C-terminal domain-containing protein [Halobacteriovoraceae bacterium]MCB9095220.1 YiiD C-terminal domain-containing protein [Halobacteriovoraceae bacterium]